MGRIRLSIPSYMDRNKAESVVASCCGCKQISYGNGLFVAVADTGIGNRVMTSPDGIQWTLRSSPVDNSWRSIAYGNGMFVAVAISGSGNRVMTSGNMFENIPDKQNIRHGDHMFTGTLSVKESLKIPLLGTCSASSDTGRLFFDTSSAPPKLCVCISSGNLKCADLL